MSFKYAPRCNMMARKSAVSVVMHLARRLSALDCEPQIFVSLSRSCFAAGITPHPKSKRDLCISVVIERSGRADMCQMLIVWVDQRHKRVLDHTLSDANAVPYLKSEPEIAWQ